MRRRYAVFQYRSRLGEQEAGFPVHHEAGLEVVTVEVVEPQRAELAFDASVDVLGLPVVRVEPVGSQQEAPGGEERGHRGAVAVDLGEDTAQGAGEGRVGLVVAVGELQSLHRDHPARSQARMQQLVELAGIESLGRAVVEHVDDVDDDHVIERRVALEIGPAVLGE